MRPPLPPLHASATAHAADGTSTLPPPSADALAHSAACAAMLRDAIDGNDGWISFARFMELALYAPGLGYYAAGARKFGAEGDFVTAPEISPLFGQTLAVTIAEVLAQTGGDVLELGPGSGKLACDILPALAARNALPDHYHLLEVSADLRQRQQQAISALPSPLSGRARWLDALPKTFTGVIIANEVLDVVPVHLVTWRAGQAHERGVALKSDTFVWDDRPLNDGALTARATAIAQTHFGGAAPNGYLTEIAPAVDGLVASLAGTLERGALIFIDYGFRAAEYYHPGRTGGTLMCHYRHYAHSDPFRHPGLQDLTAHVDFTAVATAGLEAGLQLAGYTTQANFLLASGLADLLRGIDPRDAARYLPLTNQVQRLTSPAEMGELFKVIGFTRGAAALPALDKARALPL